MTLFCVFTGLAAPPFVTRMCPPMTLKNMDEYVPRMAIGSSNGNIQIVDMSTGRVEREFANHTYPVQGIEWTSLHTVLSFAHQVCQKPGFVMLDFLIKSHIWSQNRENSHFLPLTHI